MSAGALLLVDDSADDCELLTRALAKTGFRRAVAQAHDGQEALDYLLGRGPHAGKPAPALVVLDLKMPRVGGLEVLRRLRAEPRLANQPVVILTSSDEDRDRAEAEALGVDSYLLKPLDFDGYTALALRLQETLARVDGHAS